MDKERKKICKLGYIKDRKGKKKSLKISLYHEQKRGKEAL